MRTVSQTNWDTGVFIGRPTKWGNPFVIGPDCDRKQAVQMFAQYLRKNPRLMAAARKELRGRNLLCYCAPLECHGDILLEVANSEAT